MNKLRELIKFGYLNREGMYLVHFFFAQQHKWMCNLDVEKQLPWQLKAAQWGDCLIGARCRLETWICNVLKEMEK